MKQLSLLLLVFLLTGQTLSAQDVPPEYKRFFYKFEEDASLMERGLNKLNLTSRDIGHSVALIAGVWNYPQARNFDKILEPGRKDLDKLKRYLRDHEYFHEIIVLGNEAVTFETLNYFLNEYIPDRVKSPKSRFFFAYSGHGMQDTPRDGYILTSKATTLTDRRNALNLTIIKSLVEEVVKKAYHTLVMINSCFSGAFIPVAQGDDNPLIPRAPGAHVITAGSAGQLVYGHQEGQGSDFFELVLAGLDRRADTLPTYEEEGGDIIQGDGIITSQELLSYLQVEFRRLNLDGKQMPQIGDIARRQSLGSFYFVRRDVRVKEGAIEGKVGRASAFGGAVDEVLEDFLSLGQQFLKNGEVESAIAVFTQVIQIDPNYANAYTNRGGAYENEGDYDAAIADYTRAIEINPNSANAYYNRGLAYRKKGDYDAAIADFTRAIEIDPNDWIAWMADLSRTIAESEKLMASLNKGNDAAIADYTRAIEIDPNDAIAYYNRGLAYYDKDDPDAAIADYTRAIEIDPNHANAYYYRGVAYRRIGNDDAAEADAVMFRRLKAEGH